MGMFAGDRCAWFMFFLTGMVFCPEFSGKAAFGLAGESEQLRSSFVVGALGDSVTTAVNSTGWGSQLEHSWITGGSPDGRVNSHFLRLQNTFQDLTIERHNVARGGAKAAGLKSQLMELMPHRPDYVSLLAGANDACSWTGHQSGQIEGYKRSMQEVVSGLVDTNPGIKILMLPIPHMLGLWEQGSAMGCQWLWDLSGICSPLLSSSRTQMQREEFQERVDSANQMLQEIADEFSENVKFDQSLANYRFSQEHISRLDCFHPSGAGQNLLSELAWESGWFAGQ